jgi:hypothetical protein
MLTEAFNKIGARVKFYKKSLVTVRDRKTYENILAKGTPTIDIRTDKIGEFFAIFCNDLNEINILDVQPKTKHMLIGFKPGEDRRTETGNLHYLLGFDERHWFVASVPDGGTVNVRTAMEALKPKVIAMEQNEKRIKYNKRNKRRNDVFVRQGEWFFVPLEKDLVVADYKILKNEPLLRNGGGKPHRAEWVVREGGRNIWVHKTTMRTIEDPAYQLGIKNGTLKREEWDMRRIIQQFGQKAKYLIQIIKR